jgi:putative tryptophan/tyrosine transport system substrate-binding protein
VTDRRSFIGGVAGALLASPGVTLAQQPAQGARIGFLSNTKGGLTWDAFRRELIELGYVEGRNVTIESRWAEGNTDRFPALAKELVQLKVDLIVTVSTPAALAAKQATGSIPIVMAISAYPERLGLVDSLAHPGGNVTGFSNIAPELTGKNIQLMKEMVPKFSRLAVVWNPTNPLEVISFRGVLAAASELGVQVQSIEVRSADDYPAAFAAVTAGRADALAVFGNNVNGQNAQLIVDFALKSRLPSSYDWPFFADLGGLWSYGASLVDQCRRAAGYVDKILKGAKPGDLPIQLPTTFEFVINLKTAKALGLTVPNSILLRADRVIE